MLSPYLFDARGLGNPRLAVKKIANPINGLPKIIIGSKPVDGGHYIFTDEEKDALLLVEPGAAPFLRPFIGAKEFLHTPNRWILSLQQAAPEMLQRLPKVREKIAAVRLYRSRSKSTGTQKISATPTQYHVTVIPTQPFLAVPQVSSERREYVPIGWMNPPVIPSDKVRILEGATKPLFGLLTSTMHMTWLRYVGGRLESRYSYVIGVVYNTFPTPPNWKRDAKKLEAHAQAVLDARAAYPGETLANLYDPNTMPINLRKAHQKLDRAVDKLYRRNEFTSDGERIEHLFALYEKMLTPITAKPKKRRRASARRP